MGEIRCVASVETPDTTTCAARALGTRGASTARRSMCREARTRRSDKSPRAGSFRPHLSCLSVLRAPGARNRLHLHFPTDRRAADLFSRLLLTQGSTCAMLVLSGRGWFPEGETVDYKEAKRVVEKAEAAGEIVYPASRRSVSLNDALDIVHAREHGQHWIDEEEALAVLEVMSGHFGPWGDEEKSS